jgi:SAM-dependent methyltransferase
MLVCPECKAAVTEPELRCAACGWCGELRDGVLVLLTDADRKDPVFARYLDNYAKISEDDLSTPVLDLRYVRHQAANLASFAGDMCGASVLDLGCGQGFLTKTLLNRGASAIWAVDISLPYLSRLTDDSRIRPVCANAENLPFRNTFDVAVSTDVMEHVLNVGAYLFSLNQALRPGGRVFIRVPLEENLLAYAPQLGCRYRFVHLRTFDKTLLRQALVGAGFRVDGFRIDGFNLGTPRPFWQAGPRRRELYTLFQQLVERRVRDPVSVTRWPAWLARIMMKPHELVVAATKVKSIRPVQPHGFVLEDPSPSGEGDIANTARAEPKVTPISRSAQPSVPADVTT